MAICICNWVMLLLVFGCNTRLLLVNYYTVLHCRISIAFLFSLYNPVYTVFLHYCYLQCLFLAITSLNNLFFFYNRYKIKYLHIAFDSNSVHTSLPTQCRCLAVVLGRLISFSYMFVSFLIILVHAW